MTRVEAVVKEFARSAGAESRRIDAYDAYMLVTLPGIDMRREIAVYDLRVRAVVLVAAADYRGYAGQPRVPGGRPADFDGRYFAEVALQEESGDEDLREVLRGAAESLRCLTSETAPRDLPKHESPQSPIYQYRARAIEQIIRPTVQQFAAEVQAEYQVSGWEKVRWMRGEIHLELTVWHEIAHQARPYVGFSPILFVWRRFGLFHLGQGPEHLGGPDLHDLRLDDWRDGDGLHQRLAEAKRRMDEYVDRNLADPQGLWRSVKGS